MQYIDTPAIIIDMEKVEHNLKKYQEIADQSGCNFRPHIKTHKIPRLAKMQMDFGAIGICCAKLSEAEMMAASGIKDIFIAYPIIGKEKIERFLALSRQIRMICAVDSLAGARALSEAARVHEQIAEVRLEIDTGFRRAGIPISSVLEAAREIHKLPNLNVTGIFTFKSATLGGTPTLDLEAAGREEGEMLYETAELLRSNGINIKEVSGGSTPTARSVAACKGVTELRAGTYIFQDAPKLVQKVAEESECSAAVKVTVVSTPTPYRAVIDGGVKIFAGDTKIGVPPLFLKGYGNVIGHDHLIFDHMNEEHGVLIAKDVPTGLTVGDTLYIIPNHICTSMNLCDYVYLKEKDGSYTKTRVEGRGMFY
ncbi:alanine racemase [Clostridium sp. AM58-1XD]|uniref:alanine racemase n=1 Tax=Clostridium sp. AM58-1XD TaxID=2292307 RepID=UPI000E538AF7|nr:alanine racemase [Clostridium sp. AM58-1XD]RGY99120.1 hypothetical protein DXA13_09405 [Clostridium sp. AM58-1XD]